MKNLILTILIGLLCACSNSSNPISIEPNPVKDIVIKNISFEKIIRSSFNSKLKIEFEIINNTSDNLQIWLAIEILDNQNKKFLTIPCFLTSNKYSDKIFVKQFKLYIEEIKLMRKLNIKITKTIIIW